MTDSIERAIKIDTGNLIQDNLNNEKIKKHTFLDMWEKNLPRLGTRTRAGPGAAHRGSYQPPRGYTGPVLGCRLPTEARRVHPASD